MRKTGLERKKQRTSLRDRLSKIIGLAEKPVKLSDTEKIQFKKIWEGMHQFLDDALAIILEKPRDEAYRYRDILIQHLKTADVDFVAGVKAEPSPKPISVEKGEEGKTLVRPSLMDILNSIPEDKRARAEEILECVKNYRSLMAAGERGDEVVCFDCTSEKILRCISVEDPLVKDEVDEGLRSKGLLR